MGGIISGLGSVLVNGHINGAAGFQYFWLDNGAICSLCGPETMISFIITPLVGGFFTYVFTHLSLWILGKDRARRPVFEHFTGDFDKDIDSEDIDNDASLKVKEILDLDDDSDIKTSGKTEDTMEQAPPTESRPTHIIDFESQELSESMMAGAGADTDMNMTTKKMTTKKQDDDEKNKDGVTLPKGPSSTELKLLAVTKE